MQKHAEIPRLSFDVFCQSTANLQVKTSSGSKSKL